MERKAVTGLLLVCVLLAGGLFLTTLLNYRAAQQASRGVLHSQAVQAGASFAASARLTGAHRDQVLLQSLAEEASTDGLGLVVLDRAGKVRAAARGGERWPGQQADGDKVRAVLAGIRLNGTSHRVVSGPQPTLESWRLIAAGRRRGRRWRGPGSGPLLPPGQRWGARPGPVRRRGGPLLLRVTVPLSRADALVAPARHTMVMAGVAAALLLLLGVLLYRGAARARRTDQELQRGRALSALGEMAAIMAHEIRTPLAAIKGNAQLLAEASEDDAHGAGSIVTETSRLERLVNGLLDYARPAELNRARCDADQLMTRAAEIVSPKAAAAGVTLLTDPDGSSPSLEADEDRLLQVLVNLLQNAVEACTDPAATGKSVVIRARGRGQAVTFSVLDQGPGITPGDDAIYRPFHSTKKLGTGLGLSIARSIVEQHGGTLRLGNRQGGGAEAVAEMPNI